MSSKKQEGSTNKVDHSALSPGRIKEQSTWEDVWTTFCHRYKENITLLPDTEITEAKAS